MTILEDPRQAAAWSADQRRAGRSIGFVPTMGALHEGHLALVEAARAAGGAVAASIFVNPLQFNDPRDLERYPRRLEEDLRALRTAGCEMVFVPEEKGVYEGHVTRKYDLAGLDGRLEGPSRPGHFQGVVNVVERLFHYVRPDQAFFGEKDRQQLAIIQQVATHQRWPVTIVPCPTVRAPDGLALSSRNQRLGAAERAAAPALYKALQAVGTRAFQSSLPEALAAGRQVLEAEPLIRADYLEIAHPRTLEPLQDASKVDQLVILIAAWLGPVRLIDNLTVHR